MKLIVAAVKQSKIVVLQIVIDGLKRSVKNWDSKRNQTTEHCW